MSHEGCGGCGGCGGGGDPFGFFGEEGLSPELRAIEVDEQTLEEKIAELSGAASSLGERVDYLEKKVVLCEHESAKRVDFLKRAKVRLEPVGIFINNQMVGEDFRVYYRGDCGCGAEVMDDKSYCTLLHLVRHPPYIGYFG